MAMQSQVDDGLVDELVTFSMEFRGRTVVVEEVPARVDPETGERFFSAETYDRLHAIIRGGCDSERHAPGVTYRFAA
ncbi:MAG TPA: hypothetical protein VF665_12915 [Longimicrobium sp.]|jgi:hypothetical protein|uniref:hypothetical protein n=1 Tax=Longimicrobium sp. TaxID=2029185 RepID=UPI002ED8D26A